MAEPAGEAQEVDDAPDADVIAEVPRAHGAPVLDEDHSVLFPSRDEYTATIESLVADGFRMCIDVTAVDYLSHPGRPLPMGTEPERFEVVAMVINHDRGERVRVRVQVPENDPVIASIFDIFPGSEAMEREVFDMFGIRFDEHPDPTRILMPESWNGHPLRKDYGVGEIPVQFKAAGR